ncbi:MAG: cupredoxin domain-containing protein [Minisyncoccia bacterium]|jgi:heme/copper-type cytochrome/quinol oxidase subunit 2
MKQEDETKAGGKTWRLGAVILVIVVVAAGLYYFSGIQNFLGGNQENTPAVGVPPMGPKFSPTISTSTTTSTAPEKILTDKLTGHKESLAVYNIAAENWAYTPDRLVIKKGEQVNVNFTAVDRDYDFAIAAPIGAYVSVKKGETATIGFGADVVGTYEMRCQRICPDGRDMKGELVIMK